MLNRREVLRALGLAALGGTTGRLGRVSGAMLEPAPVDRVDRIGVQLYTVRSAMQQDVEGTLARVAEIGFREVEFAGYFNRTPAQVRAALDDAGLDAPAAHVPIVVVRGGWEQALEAAVIIGHQHLIVPWIAPGERTLDGYQAVAELFNRAGEAARSAGIRFGYHNHDFEFVPVENRIPYDVLLETTDPELVGFELDLFWIAKGGQRPLDYFARYPGRFELVHVKDMAANGDMVDVGRGTIDFGAIFSYSGRAGIRHYFVEHDQPADPFESIRASYGYLRGLEF